MPLAGRFQLFVDRATRCASRSAAAISPTSRSICVAADALAERPGEPGVDHLRQAAQFLLDRLCLPDEHRENAVFGPLGVDEVVTEDLRLGLELAVDAAVALLHAAGIPGHVEVEQVPAVRLQVEAFAGGVGGDQDADRMSCWGRR